MIPALLLTAGLATRLRPLSLVRAKAALPVAGEPIVQRLLRWLAAQDVTDVVLNLHHRPETLAAVVGDGSAHGVRARYLWEPDILGSAGGPKRAVPLLQPAAAAGQIPCGVTSPDPGPDDAAPSCLIVNGDTLTGVDLGALAAHHAASGALVTLAVVPNTRPDKYGGIVASGDGAMTGVVRAGSAQRSWHFVGVQAARLDAFATVPGDVPYESIGRLYPALVAAHPGSVRVLPTAAEFFDIGTPEDYLKTSLAFGRREGRSLVSLTARVDLTAALTDTIVWDETDIGRRAVLDACIVTDRVRVPPGTTWTRTCLRVPDGAPVPGERLAHGLYAFSF